MRFPKKILAAFMIGASLLSLCACKEDPPPPPAEDDPFVVLQDTVADLYNTGVEKLRSAQSYTMTGSYVSTAEVLSSKELTSNYTPMEMSVANGQFYVDSWGSQIDPHRTYFDGTRYYFEDETDKYYTLSNDRDDYTATDFLPTVFSEIITSPKLVEDADGTKHIFFKMAFNIYQSVGLSELYGISFDDAFAAADVQVTVDFDANGYITSFLLSFDNRTMLSDDEISQSVTVSMTITNYNSAEVVPPADLDVYEDWTEDIGTDPTEPIGELTDEDLN